MIELKNVEVVRSRKKILGPISINIAENDFVGIIGPNGAGKTTLLHILLGLEPATTGSIRMAHETFDVSSRRYQNLAKQSWGVLFQNHAFQPDVPFSVADVVAFGRSRHKADKGKAVLSAMEQLGLSAMQHHLYRDLSGGEKQKVQIARLLAQAVDGWLLDEPTSGLDLDWQERLIRTVEKVYYQSRKTIIMVTHDVDHLPACCNRLIMLKKGRIVAQGRPEVLCEPEHFSQLYGCDMEVVQRNGRFYAFSLGPGEDA